MTSSKSRTPRLEMDYKWDKREARALPKGPLPSHMYYYMMARDKYHKENEKRPESERLSYKQINVHVRAEYRKLSEMEKEEFTVIRGKDRKRYDAQLEELDKKGYFTLTDGTKSNTISQPEPAKKRKSLTPRPMSRGKRPAMKSKK